MKRLIDIQKELKAPKWQYNSFWKYKYRSCEDIIEAVKPLLEKNKVVLIMNDDIVEYNHEINYKSDSSKDWKTTHVEYTWPRYYVRATAELYWEDGKLIARTVAYAREEQEKSWMDWAQVTGASSSYARKYALNWLFAIDDGVDADSTNKSEEKSEDKSEEKKKPRFNKEQLDSFTKKAWDYKDAEEALKEIRKYYNIGKEKEAEVRKLYESLKAINDNK